MKYKQVLIIAAILMFGAGAFLLFNKSSDNTQKNSSSTSEASASTGSEKHAENVTKLPTQKVGQQPDCSLYTLDDMAKIWGVPMTDTDVDGSKVLQITGPQNYQYECDYNQTNSGSGLSVVIDYKVYEDEAAAKQSIKNTRDGAKFGDKVYFINDDVNDIGDEAFFSKSANPSSITAKTEEQLYARKGNQVYLITAVDLAGAPSGARDKILQTYRLRLQ